MKSLWNDAEAEETIARYGPSHGEDVALRLYTSWLIGRDRRLVLHGGGNTSVKTRAPDLLGRERDVLRVKASGRDLARLRPEDLVAVALDPLRELRAATTLDDEQMVDELRRATLRAAAPAPSLETFLHAFLPARFVDHAHADAILVLSNQPDGRALLREALGEGVAVLGWVRPGFPLARAVAEAYEARPDAEAIVLGHHGLFTFADEARASYEKLIEVVDRAERFLERRVQGPPPLLVPPPGAAPEVAAVEVLPVVRGALAWREGEAWRRLVADLRTAGDLAAFSRHPEARRLAGLGPLTPDHLIRTKGPYLVLEPREALDPDRARAAVAAYAERYRAWFEEHRSRLAEPARMSDPHPRVVLVEGLGLIGFGEDALAARVAADIAEQTVRAKALAEAFGRYEELDPGEQFAQEYWPLERRKLAESARRRPLLAGQIGLVTGAAGAIGHGIARALLEAGAHVVVTDLDEERLDRIARKLATSFGEERVARFAGDVTDPGAVAALFEHATMCFGGVDVVVPNAGIAYVSSLAEMDPERFAKVLEVNTTGTMLVLREAARVFARQRSGGAVVVQASKNVFDPSANFGAYSASKAAAHQLGKIAALELAPLGVTVNMVNADGVFGDDEVPSGLWQEVGPDRMRARGLDPEGLREYYRQRNLLKVSVTPAHVGAAVVFFAAGATPTTGATLPVDGGIAGAFPR